MIGIIQARMGASRLPGKVLRVLGTRTVLGRVVDAARESGALGGLVVATTREPEDDAVVAECARLRVECFRGSTDDVLGRFLGALDEHPAGAVMRLTADNPLLDPDIMATAARVYHAVPGLDYLSTSLARRLPLGMDVEIIRSSALRALDGLATGHHRTHVTSFAYAHPELFRVLGLTVPPDRSHLRLTLDTEADWAVVRAVAAYVGDATVSLPKLAEWLDTRPDLSSLNAAVAQKAIEEA
jgi:spore coat polysaccharide biosynthesis protein SpsF